MKLRFFDFEVFPHWWCCTFGDMPDNMEFTEDIKDSFVVVRSDKADARDTLINLLKEPDVCNCGYNIKFYDLMIANAIYQGFTPEQVKIVNDLIIRPDECKWASKEHIRLQPFANKRLSGIVYEDLMDDSDGSLKEKESSLGLNILESNVSFDKEDLTEEDIQDVILYNKHDVYASMIFYKEVVAPYAHTKDNLGKRFGIDIPTCRRNTNATIVGMVLGARKRDYDDEERIDIVLPSKIQNYCERYLPLDIINYVTHNKVAKTVKLYGNEVTFADGGIHSTPFDNIYVEANDEYILVNNDAKSYYPSSMVSFDLISRSCTNPERFEMIRQERLTLSAKEDLTPEEAELIPGDKLVMNTCYGASGRKGIALYDPYRRTSVCRVGQLLLAAFANHCYMTIPNLKVIQTNTDGILMYLPRKWLYKLHELRAEFTRISDIPMDEDIVDKIWQCNVNNYLMIVDKKGKKKIKSKGGWLRDTQYNPGTVKLSPLSAFICAKAAKEYLLNHTDIMQTIVNCKDLSMFAITCTKGPNFSKVVQRMSDGTENTLYKCNRVIATKDTSYGKIFKCKMNKGNLSYYKMPDIPEHCKLVNEELAKYNFTDIQKELDYTYYILKTISLLDIVWYELKGADYSQTSRFLYNIG